MKGRLLGMSFSVALSLVGVAFGAPHGPVEFRRHLLLSDAHGVPLYSFTEIGSLSEKRDQRRLLVEDMDGRRYVMYSDADFESHLFAREIRDLRSREFIRTSYRMPGNFTTRSELLAHAKANPAMASDDDLNLTVDTGSVTITALQKQWTDRTVADVWRRQLRVAMSPLFLEALETFGTYDMRNSSEFTDFYSLILTYVLHRNECPSDSLATSRTIAPDCTFDRGFGFPCTDRQQELVKAAAERKEILEHY